MFEGHIYIIPWLHSTPLLLLNYILAEHICTAFICKHDHDKPFFITYPYTPYDIYVLHTFISFVSSASDIPATNITMYVFCIIVYTFILNIDMVHFKTRTYNNFLTVFEGVFCHCIAWVGKVG